MGESREDPPFIINLMDQSSDHNCYFLVGDPEKGEFERIGVVSAMLMAHSLVFRRVLSIQESELRERWDIPFTDINPKTFKNMLKYTYGYNNISSHSMSDAVDLLSVASRLVMQPLLLEVGKHIVESLNPENVCIALENPATLNFKKVEKEIAKMIQNSTMAVLGSRYLHYMCPAGMRYIVLLESLKASEADVWRAVIKWARRKVLLEQLPLDVSRLEWYVRPKLILPQLKYIRRCSLNVISLVEQACSRVPMREDILAVLSHYHFVSTNPRRSIYVCTDCTDKHHITHELFEVKVIHDCCAWIDAILKARSELVIHTTGSSVELFSVVCTGKREQIKMKDLVASKETKDDQITYECSCTIKVFLVTDSEEHKESLISEIEFKDQVMFNEEFQILLHSKDSMLRLESNRTYKIEAIFSSPHPLWYNNDIDYILPNKSSDLEIGCGLVSDKSLWYGSHVRNVLYRPASS